MTNYLLRRALLMIPTLIGITFLVFFIVASAPGGIGAAVLAQAGSNMTASSGVAIQRAYLEDRYGLSDPTVVQYVRWLGRISPIKFGTRDMVLPSGDVVTAPKPAAEPPLWKKFAPEMMSAPAPAVPEFAELNKDDRMRLFRRTERKHSDARYAVILASGELSSQLTAYARAIKRDDLVLADGQPDISKFEAHTPETENPQWQLVAEKATVAIDTYGRSLEAFANFQGLFRARPFEGAGVGLIPGAMYVSWPDFGTAFSSSRPVIELIPPALLTTLTLNFVAVPIIYLVAVPSGILAAVRRGSWLDFGLGSMYIGLYSFPVVLAGVLCIGFLASKDYLGAFPVAGLHSQAGKEMAFLPCYDSAGLWQRGWLLDMMWHMALPVLCLTYTGFAVLSKQTRAAMLENFSADYVRTAKAKGVSNHDVTFAHVFRNSLIPLITIFVTVFPGMLAGSVVVERIFTIPGMGSLMIEAINNRDVEVILANTVMIAVVNLLALLLADFLYALADPRVAYE